MATEIFEVVSDSQLSTSKANSTPAAQGQLRLAVYVDNLAEKAGNAKHCLEEGQVRYVSGSFSPGVNAFHMPGMARRKKMGLKVIGAGFGRTGTMSMKAALEQLGFGPCYHMVECFPQGPEHWQKWVDAASGKPDWDSLFEGFESAVDFPACSSYKALAAHYPDAKVILTVRDPERWFESTQETIFAPHWMEYLRSVEMGKFVQLTINDYLQDRMHDKQHLVQRFQEHIEEVRKAIPASRLLVFEVKNGWGPLCEFLELPVPDTDFPFINDTEATKEIINKIIAEGPEAVFGYSGV